MSLPGYPSYEESGFAWLGPLPAHWEARRLGTLFDERREKVSDKDFQPLSVTMRGVVPQIETAAKTDDGDNRKLVRSGDFVINSRSDRKGSAGLSRLDGSVSLINTVLFPREQIEPGFCDWLLRSIPFQQEFYRWGRGIVADLWTTKFSEMKGITLPLPPILEQKAIAAFLDRETGKIDALVEEQKRLIELLKEKRQAVISHAVTKGLNSDVPMKSSGIEWLGDVPEHWGHSRAGRFIHVLSGYAFPSGGFSHDENHTRLLRGVNVGVGEIRWEDVVYWERSDGDGLAPFELWEGALVIGMDRPFIGAGVRVARIQKTDLPCLLLQRVGAISTNDRLCVDFFHLLLQSEGFMHFVAPDMTGVSVPHISPGQLREFPIPVPPVEEQRQIVAFVSSETAKIDALTSEAEEAISLLQERRCALISAAVTGKIDVRGMVATETEAA